MRIKLITLVIIRTQSREQRKKKRLWWSYPRYLLMWNRERIPGIYGYLFDPQKTFHTRRAFPKASKRMRCFDSVATVLFLHSSFHLQLTFMWAETCSSQHSSPCVCDYHKSRIIQELHYHGCFPQLCLQTEVRSGEERSPGRSKSEYVFNSLVLSGKTLKWQQRLKTKL